MAPRPVTFGQHTLHTRGALDPNALVRCHCGRQVIAEMMVYIGHLPALADAHGAPYACDGCFELALLRGEHCTKEEYLESIGAPAALLDHVRRDRAFPRKGGAPHLPPISGEGAG